jgi:hypothetical protein
MYTTTRRRKIWAAVHYEPGKGVYQRKFYTKQPAINYAMTTLRPPLIRGHGEIERKGVVIGKVCRDENGQPIYLERLRPT